MLIKIGSKNKVKIKGTIDALRAFSFDFTKTENFDVDSGVRDQPLTRQETIDGACNRAKKIWQNNSIAIGLEDGLIKVAQTKTGFMNVCVCSIFDGNTHSLGFSSAFELPQNVIDAVLNKNLNLSQACKYVGLTEKNNIGTSDGIIGLLSKGVITRCDYVFQAVISALVAYDT